MSEPVEPGRVLGGRYRLDRQLARGGMGTVWEAEDPLLSRFVAVKVLDPVLAADERVRERFKREAVAAAAVTHPNIVATYDTGEDDGIAYIVMELVRGRTLRQVMDRLGPMPVTQAADLGAQVADALAHAHERGLVHRDVKPGNVLVTADGRVKVTDFGIAKAAGSHVEGDDLTRAGTVVGTARYLAPEQVDGGDVDARADVYSLGLVLYEMLAGAPPFSGDSDIATAVARLTGEPPALAGVRDDVPPGLEAVVDAALVRDREGRIPTAAALRDALAPYRRESQATDPTMPVPVPVRPAAAPPAAVAVAPRRRVSGGAIALWVLAVAVGVGIGFWGWRAITGSDDGATPTTTTVAPHVLPISGVVDFDPEGDGRENPSSVRNVIDGSPTTSWSTERYTGSRAFSNTKQGVGLVLDLGATRTVTRVEADAVEADWDASVYVSATPATSLAGWGPVVGTGSALGTTARIPLEAGATGRYVLLWITNLPPSLKLTLTEVRVVGT